MEYELAARICDMCSSGMPVYLWVVKYERRLAFHNLHPNKYPRPNLDDNGNDDGEGRNYPKAVGGLRQA